MQGAIGKFPLGDARTELELYDHLIAQDNGDVTVSYADGTVRSVQPDGRVEHRPAGANGFYERARVNGGILTSCPDGKHVYDFAHSPQVPNQ
jgi:hypothetical protein